MREENLPRKITFIYNPIAGGKRKNLLFSLEIGLICKGFDVTVEETTHAGHAGELATAALENGADCIAVAGGDGTVNEVLNAVATSRLNSVTPIAILPFGTANVAAWELGIPALSKEIMRLLIDGTGREVQLARAGSRLFLLMAGIGYDAHVIQNIDNSFKRRYGKLAYIREILRMLRHPPHFEVSGTIDGEPFTAASVIFTNACHYAGPYRLMPAACLTKPEIHAVLFHKRSRLSLIRYMFYLALGRLQNCPGVEIRPCQTATVTAPEGSPVEVDGDLSATVPLTISAGAETVTLLVPPDKV